MTTKGKEEPKKPAPGKPEEKKETGVKVPEPTMSERFTAMVVKEFGGKVGRVQVTDSQRRLIQGYFIGIDHALKKADDDRIRKNEANDKKGESKWNNSLEISWKNVNLPALALDIMHYATMGLDMMQDNHLSPIPYKNSKTQKYDITLMEGYNGIKYLAEKYGAEKPLAVNVELVYSTDTFVALKKNHENKIEGYEFKINEPFKRGDIVGGFGYIEYSDQLKNKLIIMTLEAIKKRKPPYAAAEFWGGTKTKWVADPENPGKKKPTEIVVEGWLEEMYKKTVIREVYGAKNMPLDPQKIDEHLQYLREREAKHREAMAEAEIAANANKQIIDVDPTSSRSEQVPEAPDAQEAPVDPEIPADPGVHGESPEPEIELGKDNAGQPVTATPAGNGAGF